MKLVKNIIKRIYSQRFLACGKGLRFNPFTCYIEPDCVKIGTNVFINTNAYIAGKVIIGDNVLIGPYVTIVSGSANHNYSTVGKYINMQEKAADEPIYIGNDCWICAKTILLNGAGVGEGSIIGAASVVTKLMPPYCLCFGVPCKPIDFRYSDDELREHFRILNRDSDEAEEIIQERQNTLGQFS